MNNKSIYRAMAGGQCTCAMLVVLMSCTAVFAKKNTAAATPTTPAQSTPTGDTAGGLSAVADPFKQLINQGQFQQALTEVNAAIAKQTSKTDKADRYALLMIKGEIFLHLKAGGAAQDAFASAAKVGPDDNSVSVANGTVTLLKHAGSLKYLPKTKSSDATAASNTAIDIIDPTSRKDAFSALFTDMAEPLKPKVAAMANSTSLSAITAMAKQVDDARDVEIAGTGSDPQSKDLLQKLATPAGAILSATLKPFSTEVDNIGKDAAKHQKLMGKKAPVNSASLTPPDASQLDTIASEAQQVSATCTQMEPIFGDAGDFKSIKDDADKIVEDVNKILKEYKHQTVSSS